MMRPPDFISRDDGTSAAEFALVLGPFVTVILASLGLSVMLWANSTLHFAAEDAARCAVVKTSVCTDSASIVSYANSHYNGPNISPVFTPTNSGCGAGSWTVTATATYPLNTGLFNFSVPLSAIACFP